MINLTCDGWVRHTDLYFRSLYPYIDTTIYEKMMYQYVIVVKKEQLLIDDDFKKYFHNSIRSVALSCDISNDIPFTYSRIIPNIKDNEIGKSLDGLYLTNDDFYNLVTMKFPNVVTKIGAMNQNRTQVIYVKELNATIKQKVLDFCNNLKLPITFEIQQDDKPCDNNFILNDLMRINSSHANRFNLPYLKEDDNFWLENVNDIYEGKITKKDFSFFNPDVSSCYLDMATGLDENFRNNILLYDTIYCSLPLEDYHDKVFKDQSIDEKQFLELVEKGVIKILMTQSELRQNISLIEKAYECNPNSIIGRRKISAFCISNFVENANNYILAKDEYKTLMPEISKTLSEILKLLPENITKMLMWPVYAMRNSFNAFFSSGTKGMGGIGVSNFIAESLKKTVNKDLQLELTISEENVQIANALNATYFPCHSKLMSPFAKLIGNYLSYYENFNQNTFKPWNNNLELRTQANNLILSPIDLIDFKNDIPLTELYNLNSQTEKQAGRKLISYLSELSEEERAKTVIEYNDYLRRERLAQQGRQFSIDSIQDDGFDFLCGFLNIVNVLSGIIFMKKISQPFINKLRISNKKFDKFCDLLLSTVMNDDEKQLSFLRRLDIVASIKTSINQTK